MTLEQIESILMNADYLYANYNMRGMGLCFNNEQDANEALSALNSIPFGSGIIININQDAEDWQNISIQLVVANEKSGHTINIPNEEGQVNGKQLKLLNKAIRGDFTGLSTLLNPQYEDKHEVRFVVYLLPSNYQKNDSESFYELMPYRTVGCKVMRIIISFE